MELERSIFTERTKLLLSFSSF